MVKSSLTFVQCHGCNYYLGSGDGPFCEHPEFKEPGFLKSPIEECHSKLKSKQKQEGDTKQ